MFLQDALESQYLIVKLFDSVHFVGIGIHVYYHILIAAKFLKKILK